MAVDPSWLRGIPSPPRAEELDDRELVARLDVGRATLLERDLVELYPGLAWALLVGQEGAQLRRLQASYPFVDRLSFGFVEPEIDRRDPGLAVIVHVDPPEELLADAGLHDAYPEAEPLVAEGQPFPVVVRIGVQEPQVKLSSPSTAMLAVWTTVHRSTSPQSGWLLPFHAVGSKSAIVTYDDGSAGRVVESFGECMDAVVASSTAGPPVGVNKPAATVLAPGLTLKVIDQHGTAWTPTLMDVDVNLGLIRYTKAPIRLTYDWATSARGDSGSLVTDAVSGAPVAMHQGVSKIRDRKGDEQVDNAGNPIRRAFGLCLYQIQATADAEFLL